MLATTPLDAVATDATMLAMVLTASTALLLVLGIVLLVAWLRARGRARRTAFDRAAAERQRIDLELGLAEQTGRLRIIREVHEVSVLALTGIISQADGARYAASADPSAAARAAESIGEAARTTLGDLRRVIGLASEGEASAAPQPRLTSTSELFDAMRESGLEVVFEESGEPFDLQPGAELAIYRILQEALANALSYGGPGTAARVSFTWGTEGLHVKVDDDGIRSSARRAGLDPNDASAVGYTIDDDLKALTDEPSGRGIHEMRSRAELYGGILTASTVPGVGFSLSVVFPALRFHNGVHGVKLDRS
ncbi:sensor histidine kinase [Microcella humidisoli]|jgi:signal transduction histidine kinase|uniref:histidine kinase n=1 Tax=Microcella humidisoli TaxID=2963406 RepID=A0ABY5FW35_9MICO|nr:ATP-binding protein [Microcella humidisoli]UTT62473.1 histidine kinase [Microcella humidisoli]